MAKKPQTEDNSVLRDLPPVHSQEAREARVVSLAFDLVEERLRKGTATSQETTAIIRLGCQRAKLEREKLAAEAQLATAKAGSLEEQKKNSEMLAEALKAIRAYTGHDTDEEGLY